MTAIVLQAIVCVLFILSVLFLFVAGGFVNAAWLAADKRIEVMYYGIASLFSIAATLALMGLAVCIK